MQIGAQFYTIREFCKTTEDLAESLKKVADIGYKNVQISGVCECDPQWLKAELNKNGLRCIITHTKPELLLENTDKVIEAHDILESKYVGLGTFRFNPDDKDFVFSKFVEAYTPVIDKLTENGKYFMYHNHAREFNKENGKLIMDMLEENFAADKLGFTLDTYWVQTAGADPAYWIERLSGRVPCIHLKDHSFDRKMAVVGEGNINFERIFQKAQAAGTEYMLVEQDDCNGEDPFDCLRRSYEFLKSRGFE